MANSSNSTSVDRPLPADTLDLGNLLLIESNDLKLDGDKEEKLRAHARDNAQLLLNELFSLAPKKVDDVTVTPLPPPTYKLPRAKPVPKPKPLTKWEKYAKEKGIEKKKKTKLVWDDVVKEWVPRYGYKKAKAEEAKNWMMEYKGNAQDADDPFEKAREDKRERVAKNELQRLRNIARARKVKVPGVGLTPVKANSSNKPEATELKRAADLARSSTASLGKFQPNLKSALEKQAKNGAPSEGGGGGGKRRKFDPLVNKGEKEKSLKILEQLTSKKPKLDVGKAVGVAMQAEERERAASKKGNKNSKSNKGKGGGAGKRGGGGGTKRRGQAGKKPRKGAAGGRKGGGKKK